MQKGVRFNEGQLLYLASKARHENTISGFLSKKSSDTGKWQQRYFVLYQNLLFYFENESIARPSGVALVEGSYCERLITPVLVHKGRDTEKQYCFTITYRSEGQRQYDLRCDSESECKAWIDALQRASYSKVQEQKEELEQKHLHLLQILDSERQAKWQYVQQTEELAIEVKKLKAELQKHQKESCAGQSLDEETDEIKKIKKVQSFFRGWLCRRRWKQIVDLYIRSPHAESMRKRNSIVFSMVECEEEYNRQLSCLVTCFLRPLRMAASSKKPPISHEDVNSIFLNSETLLFLHQIFLKGLTARLENWPTLVLGDLFDMLLPMLSIYQEYVRNHHYSLQVLAEYKQRVEFNGLLRRYEEKSVCEGRTLETFLTYPMHQIPRYIITLHELLAHTPHEHVERRSLEFAKSKLEELSKVMHDEVSETENIRKNLSIERMIVEGCDILLDVNQTFVRQGPLLQVIHEKGKTSRGRLGSFSSSFKESKKELVRQVFLFTNHIIFTVRAANGRLHLAKVKAVGKIPLAECTLIEDPGSDVFFFDEETSSIDSNLSLGSQSSIANLLTAPGQGCDQAKMADYNGLDFRLIVDSKSGPPTSITLVASTLHEKSAWCSDISQCIENLLYSDLLNNSMSESSSVTMPQSVRSDPKLFRDDVDIKFSRTLNSCKVPQIRHASVERLLERLTDLRFLSIDFLNTFLLTYRVFTTGSALLDSLKKVYRTPDTQELLMCDDSSSPPHMEFTSEPPDAEMVIKPHPEKYRRRVSACGVNEILPEGLQLKDPVQDLAGYMAHADTERTSPTFISFKYERTESLESDDSRCELANFLSPPRSRLAPIASCETLCDSDSPEVPTITTDDSFSGILLPDLDSINDSLYAVYGDKDTHISTNGLTGLTMTDSLVPGSIASPNTISSAASSDTLTPGTPRLSPVPSLSSSPKKNAPLCNVNHSSSTSHPVMNIHATSELKAVCSPSTLTPLTSPVRPRPASSSPVRLLHSPVSDIVSKMVGKCHSQGPSPSFSPATSPKLRRALSPISYSYSSPNIIAPPTKIKPFSCKRGSAEADSINILTPRGSMVQIEGSPPQAKAGAVVTSSRASKRRSSSSAATTAFAAATAGLASCSGTPIMEEQKSLNKYLYVSSDIHSPKKRESVIFTAATMRVLNVLKHWVSKHQQDFESDVSLKSNVIEFLEEMISTSNLLPTEHKTAASILRTITKDSSTMSLEELNRLLAPPLVSPKDNFDTLSALDIAEQLTYLDHKIFMSINSEELLSQAWMKPERSSKAVHVLLVSKRFNEVSRLVVSEIVQRYNQAERIACIEKWAAIADICRCMHNYNGVLQICAAFVNSSVYRLKKTWERLSKQTKQMVEKLQVLVSSEGRFKNMREALHRCDPPCIPYLGMYLTDLSFIEEGTPNFTEEGLVNFSKMRMIAHVIREIRLFQQTAYKIEHHPRVTTYLLDPFSLLDEDHTYKASLEIEPKLSRLSVVSAPP